MPLPEKNMKDLEHHIRGILVALGEEPDSAHFQKTPQRVAKFFASTLDGNFRDPEAFKERMTQFDEQDWTGMIAVHGHKFYSYCAHHMALFHGRFSLGYLPSQRKVLGASKLIRIFREGCRLLTTQEAITHAALTRLRDISGCPDVICHVHAEHTCMSCRGVQSHAGAYVTEDVFGFKDKEDRIARFFAQAAKECSQ